MPEPADVRVRLLHATEGEPAGGVRLSWYGMPPPQPSGVTTGEVERDPKSGTFDFRAPIGEIVLVITGGTYGMVFEPARIAMGSNQLDVWLDAKCEIEVALMDGSLVVSPGDETRLEAHPLGGVGSILSWSRKGSKLGLLLDQPGPWEVGAEGLPAGYAMAAAVRIVARAGETVRCELPVFRTR